MAADTVAVRLLQPTKLGGKPHAVDTELDLPADQAQGLVDCGAAEPVQAKPAGKVGSKKAAGPAPAAD